MIWRPSSTSSRGPQRLVGGPRRTGQCASFRCFAGESLIAAQQLPVQNLLVCARSLSLFPSSISSISKPVPLPRSCVNLPPRTQPRWGGSQAPESAGLRPLTRGAGSASPTSSATPVSPLSPRQFLDLLPATRAGGEVWASLFVLRGPGALY